MVWPEIDLCNGRVQNALATAKKANFLNQKKYEFVSPSGKLPDKSELKLGNYVYIFENLLGDCQKTTDDFAWRKDKDKERNYSRDNKVASRIMYVGSSTTGLYTRLRQHIKSSSKKTYSLHLIEWFNEPFNVWVRDYDVSGPALQIIEDAIAYELKPAFGKPGGNGK